MTPQQFLTHIKGALAPAYLFTGTEPYQRDYCRRALIKRVLPDEESRENGLTRHDLRETTIAEIVDDARSPSLFSPDRVIVVSHAEDALPKPKPGQGDPEPPPLLAQYMKSPSPGVALVFDTAAYGLQGDDKKKLDRVRKFYSAIPAEVEFAPMSPAHARQFAETQARRAGLQIGPAELDALAEGLGFEAARIAAEIEKLRLYAGDRPVTANDLAELVPDARESTIFALVDALGRRDRARSLALLDILIRQGEYLPLALNFLSGQLRMAMAAKEAGLHSPRQVQSHFSGSGVPVWPARAEQIYSTVAAFSMTQFAEAMKSIAEADKALRSSPPDERLVMEEFVLRLTR